MDADLPGHASVVVIGGGAMGCSTLFHLAEFGVTDAVLLERAQLTSGTTWHSAAQVRALRHSQNLTRMIQYSIDLYSRLERETGQAVGWIQKGSLSIATTPDRLTHVRRQAALARRFGVEASEVTAEEALERWPLMRIDDVLGAVWSPDDGRVSPSDVCAALVKAARRLGARIFEETAVTGILTEGGRVVGVETARGVVQTEAVVVCAGLWSREVAAMAGACAPLMACEHFYLLTKPVEGLSGNLPTLSDHDGHLYIRDDGGGLLVGCFEPMGKPIRPEELGENFAFGLLPEDWDYFEPMMRNALHRLPPLETAEVRTLLNGPESFTPDGMFMLGETPETRGLYLGCGMNSVGLASAGGAGMSLAHLIARGHLPYDLSEADAARFAPVFDNVAHLTARAPEVLGTHYEIAYPGRQLRTARDLRDGPLTAIHRQDGAVMAQAYGWERPVYFGAPPERLTFGRPPWHDAVAAEAMAAHQASALFDLSPFGKIEVAGPDAEAFLAHVCAGFVRRPPGSVVYTAILNARGTFESDLMAMRLAEDRYRLTVGAAAIARDLAWLCRAAEGFRVTLEDVTESLAVVGLMGPDAPRIAEAAGAGELTGLGYFKHAEARMFGRPVVAARASYVGEAGWEISIAAEDAAEVYQGLKSLGAWPAGLYAQTSMRIEKGFRAVGHELDGDMTPLDVGLDRFVDWSRDFVGAEALRRRRAEAADKWVATLIFEDPAAEPLGHEPVYLEGAIIGQTTSAAFGFRLGRPIALAPVETPVRHAQVDVDIAGARFQATMQPDPAYDPKGLRMRLPAGVDGSSKAQ